MVSMEGKYEGASNFIFSIRSYILGNLDEAKNYARKAIYIASNYKTILNCFICDLSTLVLIILGEFELKNALEKVIKLANSIPLIPPVWITLVECWKKLDNTNIDCNHFLSELKYLDNDIIKNKADILQQLIAIKNNICNSTYLKEILLNTCGFATEWIPSIWRLTNIKCFLFTITELTTLVNKIGPLRYILKPISTLEVYNR